MDPYHQIFLKQEKKYEQLKEDTSLTLADKETALLIGHKCMHREQLDVNTYISKENYIAASFIFDWTDFFVARQTNERVTYIYNYYRKCGGYSNNHGYLEYKSSIQIALYNFMLTNPSQNNIVEWFQVNVPTINTVKYGLTNGNIDYYHGGCFAAETRIVMADGSLQKIENIKKGDMVKGGFEVVCVLEWKMELDCVQVGELFITPWHPILMNEEWVFPCRYLGENNISYTKRKVYNLVLDNGHVVCANGVEACTLGHGFTDNDVIKHSFFGTERVLLAMQMVDPEGWVNGTVRASALLREENDEIVGLLA